MRVLRRDEPGNADERAAAWARRTSARWRGPLWLYAATGAVVGPAVAAMGYLKGSAIDLFLQGPWTLPMVGGLWVLGGTIVGLVAGVMLRGGVPRAGS